MVWPRILIVALLSAISVVITTVFYTDQHFSVSLTTAIVVNIGIVVLATGTGMLIGHNTEDLAMRLGLVLGVSLIVAAIIVVPLVLQRESLIASPELPHIGEIVLWSTSFVFAMITAALLENLALNDRNDEGQGRHHQL